MQKIRVGVMGCAQIAERSVIPAMLELPEFELLAVASRTKEKSELFATRFGCQAIVGYDKLLSAEIDAVYMPLPTGLHEEWVEKCLKAGKHLLVEKSFACDHASAKRLIELAKASKLVVMENFMFLNHGQHQVVKELLDSGEIGELRCFRSSFGFPPLDPSNFRYDKVLGGGALLDAGAYTVRASQLFLGDELSVAAASLNYGDNEADIYGGAFLKSPNGMFSEVGFGFDNYYQCNYELWGSKGKITAHRAFTPKPDQEPEITIETPDGTRTIRAKAENHFKSRLKEWSQCIMSKNLETGHGDILNQSRLLDEVLAASRT